MQQVICWYLRVRGYIAVTTLWNEMRSSGVCHPEVSPCTLCRLYLSQQHTGSAYRSSFDAVGVAVQRLVIGLAGVARERLETYEWRRPASEPMISLA